MRKSQLVLNLQFGIVKNLHVIEALLDSFTTVAASLIQIAM